MNFEGLFSLFQNCLILHYFVLVSRDITPQPRARNAPERPGAPLRPPPGRDGAFPHCGVLRPPFQARPPLPEAPRPSPVAPATNGSRRAVFKEQKRIYSLTVLEPETQTEAQAGLPSRGGSGPFLPPPLPAAPSLQPRLSSHDCLLRFSRMWTLVFGFRARFDNSGCVSSRDL